QRYHTSYVLPQRCSKGPAFTCQVKSNSLDRRMQCVEINTLRRQCDDGDLPSFLSPIIRQIGRNPLGSTAAHGMDKDDQSRSSAVLHRSPPKHVFSDICLLRKSIHPI